MEIAAPHMTQQPDLEPLRDWFRRWNTCLLTVDFARARGLFDPAVSGFGTHADIVFGLDRLEAEQWRNVWPLISDFRFHEDALHGGIAGAHAWAACPWSSTGYDSESAKFARPGRATVILKHTGDGWRGVHTHFSLNPGTPGRTYGKR
jgi:ketosteroid isomerase-like protein